MEVRGRVVLITGGARRVGRAIALELARAGCDIAVHCLKSVSEADQVVAEVRSLGRRAAVVVGDLADSQAPGRIVERTVCELGGLDVLVNNASIFERTPVEEADAATWERMLRINTVAPALLAREAAPIMRVGGGGRIVNLLDILADRPIRRYGPYCASKAALANLTRTLAAELAPEITVNGISPGIAIFPEDYDEELRRRLTAKVPLGRTGSPEEVAALVRYLVTEGDYITGQIIAIDGGMSL